MYTRVERESETIRECLCVRELLGQLLPRVGMPIGLFPCSFFSNASRQVHVGVCKYLFKHTHTHTTHVGIQVYTRRNTWKEFWSQCMWGKQLMKEQEMHCSLERDQSREEWGNV